MNSTMEIYELSPLNYLNAEQRAERVKSWERLLAEYQLQIISATCQTELPILKIYAWALRAYETQKSFMRFLEVSEQSGIHQKDIEAWIRQQDISYQPSLKKLFDVNVEIMTGYITE